jgi:hypothetical protein
MSMTCRLLWIALVVPWCSMSPWAGELVVRGKPDGFFGDYTQKHRKIYFDVTASSTAKHSKIWRDAGTMTELRYEDGAVVYKIAGFPVTQTLTAEQQNRQIAVMTSPEAELVPDMLDGLKQLGIDTKSPAVTILLMATIAYKKGSLPNQPSVSCATCANPATDCFGCCSGPGGCTFCNGTCTSFCAAHDACVGTSSYFNPLCNGAIQLALESWLTCAWTCSGSGCVCCGDPSP